MGSRITPEYSEDGRAVHRGKGVTERRSLYRKHGPNTKDRHTMPTSLQGIAHKARSDKGHRFRHRCGMRNAPFLWSCWQHLRKEAASGVDRVTAAASGRHILPNVRDLSERVKRGAYRTKWV